MVIKILRSMTDDVTALPFISYLSLISAVIVPSFFVQAFDVHPIYSAVFFPPSAFGQISDKKTGKFLILLAFLQRWAVAAFLVFQPRKVFMTLAVSIMTISIYYTIHLCSRQIAFFMRFFFPESLTPFMSLSH